MNRKHKKLSKCKTLEEFKVLEKKLKDAIGEYEYSQVYGVESEKMKQNLQNASKIINLQKAAIVLSKKYLNKKLFLILSDDSYYKSEKKRKRYIEMASYEFLTPLKPYGDYNSKNYLEAEVIETTYKIGTRKIIDFTCNKVMKMFEVHCDNISEPFLELESSSGYKYFNHSLNIKATEAMDKLYKTSLSMFLKEVAPILLDNKILKKDKFKSFIEAIKEVSLEDSYEVQEHYISEFMKLMKEKKVTLEDVLPKVKKYVKFPPYKGVELLELACYEKNPFNNPIFVNTNIVSGTGDSDYEPYTTHYYLYSSPEINWEKLLYPIRNKLKSVFETVEQINQLNLVWDVHYDTPHGYGDASFLSVKLSKKSLAELNEVIVNNLK